MGVNVNDHMLHSMSGEVTQFLDGRAVSVPAWDDPRPFTFRAPYGTADYGYMGHPEAVTLGRFLPGVRDAVVRFRWFEDEAVELWGTFARLGLTDDTEIAGLGLSPRRFLAEYIAPDPGRTNLAIAAPEPRPGAVWQVRMDGSRGGEPTRVTVEGHMVYAREVASGTGNLTAVPAATGVAELLAGRITRRGVLAPEAAIDHAEEFVRDVAARTGVSLFHTVTAGAGLAEACPAPRRGARHTARGGAPRGAARGRAPSRRYRPVGPDRGRVRLSAPAAGGRSGPARRRSGRADVLGCGVGGAHRRRVRRTGDRVGAGVRAAAHLRGLRLRLGHRLRRVDDAEPVRCVDPAGRFADERARAHRGAAGVSAAAAAGQPAVGRGRAPDGGGHPGRGLGGAAGGVDRQL